MRTASAVAVLLLSSSAAFAQSVISAHSGVLHLSEGTVRIDGKEVNQKFGTFPDIKENSKLTTERGRAEVLLTPGVFLRVGENTGIRMITNRLIDTRVEFIEGSAIVESDSPMKGNAVTIAYKDFQVHITKAGVFEFLSNPEQLKVYHGEVEVEGNGETVVVRSGKLLPFGRAMISEKFDVKQGDELARWSMQRSQDVSVANLSAAKSLRDSGASWGSGGGWFFNPYYSMYTYIPGNGVYFNPYGYGFWSPYSVYGAYAPGGYYSGGNNASRTPSGHNGDQSGSFGRATAATAATGFGRASAGVTNTGMSSAASAAAPSGGGTGFSGGGSGGGSRGGGGHR